MGAPHLKVIDSDSPAICGAKTRRGGPCRNPAGEGGRCWLPSHQDRERVEREGLPEPPEHIGELGREYWRYHVGRCMDAGVLEIVDMTVIEKAAEVSEIMRKCWSHVQKHGPTVPDKNTSTKTNPALSKYNSLMPDYRQLTKQIDGWVAKGDFGEKEDGDDNPWGDTW